MSDKVLGFKIKKLSTGEIIGILLSPFISAWIVQWIWNWQCVDHFYSPHLGYWSVFFLVIMVQFVKGSRVFGPTNYQIVPEVKSTIEDEKTK